MPRIRTLKPEILEDEKTSRLSDTAFRLFASMIVLADDYGHVRADARWLQAQIWWAHAEPPNVLMALIELQRGELIEVYGVRGGTYASLRGWAKHQRVDNAGKGRVPMPDDPDARKVVSNEAGLVTTDEPAAIRGDSRRDSASSGEMRLDQEGDQDPDPEEDREGTPRRSRRVSPSPLPSDWKPREAEQRLAERLGHELEAEAEAFRDHYASKGTSLVDWNAAFRGWLRRAGKFNGDTAQRGARREEPREVPEL